MAPNAPVNPVEYELYSSWALLIQTFLLIGTLWTSYYLHLKDIRIIHETVISIFAGKSEMFYVKIITINNNYCLVL